MRLGLGRGMNEKINANFTIILNKTESLEDIWKKMNHHYY